INIYSRLLFSCWPVWCRAVRLNGLRPLRPSFIRTSSLAVIRATRPVKGHAKAPAIHTVRIDPFGSRCFSGLEPQAPHPRRLPTETSHSRDRPSDGWAPIVADLLSF